MRSTNIFLFLLLSVIGATACFAQEALTLGSQVNSNSLVSGKPYLFYYVGTQTSQSCYVKASDSYDYFKANWSDQEITEEAIFYFIDNGNGTWKIKSRNSGKYFPTPEHNQYMRPTDENSAGAWTLNFINTAGVLAPYCGNEGFDRNLISSEPETRAIYASERVTTGRNQCKIFEIAKANGTFADFTDKELNVATTAATTLTTDQWYVMKSGDNYFIDTPTENGSYSSTERPRGMATDKRMYLVRLISTGSGNYHVQTGYGNYLFSLPNNNGHITTRVSTTTYSAEDLMAAWNFHPVTLADPLRPTASEIYTLKNGDDPAATDKHWIFVPTGTDGQYYMYHVTTQDFAIPSGNTAWTQNTAATPVILESQGDGTHIAKTPEGTPVEYNDGNGSILNIVKIGNVAEPTITQLNTALNKLLSHQTKITDLATITDGWYAIRIHSDSNHPTYNGNFLYTLVDEYDAGAPYTYPMAHQGSIKKDPARDEAVYYFRLWPVQRPDGNTYYHWQLPNGKYIVNYKNNYPITWTRDASDFIIEKDDTDGTFNVRSSDFLIQATDNYIGKTARKYIKSTTTLDIHSIDLTTIGLTAWQVLFNDGADNTKLHCTRTDVHGLTDVYNRGYFFLPTGQTPDPSEFTMDGMYGTPVIDTEAKTISVVYAPSQCFTAEDVTVIQGSRTTGKGNTQQVLLRININPQAPFYPDRFNISITGATQIDQVQAYMTTTEQFHAAGPTPTLLGTTQTTTTDGAVGIDVSGSHLVSTGETTYFWITADIKSTAGESAKIDAAINSIVYHNVRVNDITCDISAKGNPTGNMCIFHKQNFMWVSCESLGLYYRNPALMRTTDGLIAVGEYRYDNPLAFGKAYDGSDNGHQMDIVMRKSTDNGATWSAPITIATGTTGSETEAPTGYGNPALVLTNNGKLICLMSAGANSYNSSAGLKNIAYCYSTNNGTTWSEPINIFNSINWNGLTLHSAYTPSGKGVTFPNGRIAFVLSGKNNANANTNEFILYSDDEGTTWDIASSTAFFNNGNDGKLEVMNDRQLLASIRRGNETSLEGRGYNRTESDASADGIATWKTSSNWGGNLNSYGCNNDLLYYGRSPEGAGIRDAILHTVVKEYSSERFKDMRLFVSFDQASTWKEMFIIQPANVNASSMLKLADGNLAIVFEDGSIGNDEDPYCYALNCVVISKEQMEAQQEDLFTSKIISLGETNGNAPFVNWATSGWTNSFTTKSETGVAGVVVSTTHAAFNREGNGSQRVLDVRPSAANTEDVITITAPDGYIIKSYTITGYNKTAGTTYTLTNDDGTSVIFSNGKENPATLSDNNIYKKATTFTFESNSGSSDYAHFTNFQVVLAKEYTVSLHSVGGKSYSTLYVPFDLYQTEADTKAYYITTVTSGGSAILTETPNNGRTIPHHTAVTLINSADSPSTTFAVIGNQEEVVDKDVNLLKGILVNTQIDFSVGTPYYSLGKKEGKAGYYKSSRGIETLGANRAYLETSISPVVNTKGFVFTFDDTEDTPTNVIPIESINNNRDANNSLYDLQGRKITGDNLQKGIYIRNGKKILMK